MTRLLRILLLVPLLGGFGIAQSPALRVEAKGVSGEQLAAWTSVATRARAEVQRVLGTRFEQATVLHFAKTLRDVPDRIAPSFHDWTVALATPWGGRIDVCLERVRPDPPMDLFTVLVHEFVHLALGEIEMRESKKTRHLPRWFHEGLAQEVAGKNWFPEYEEALAFRAASGRLLRWSDLERGFPKDAEELRLAYAQSSSYFGFLMRRVGYDEVLHAAARFLRGEVESLDRALYLDRSQSFSSIAAAWEEDLRSGRNALRLLGKNCFQVLLWLCIPLLFFVFRKRIFRENMADKRLQDWENAQRAYDSPEDPDADPDVDHYDGDYYDEDAVHEGAGREEPPRHASSW